MSRNVSDMTSETGMGSSSFGLLLTKPVMLFGSFVPQLWTAQCFGSCSKPVVSPVPVYDMSAVSDSVLIQAIKQTKKKIDIHVSVL